MTYVKDTIKYNFLSPLIASNSFFLSNWLSFFREKIVEQSMLFNFKYVHKSEKKQNSQNSTEK